MLFSERHSKYISFAEKTAKTLRFVNLIQQWMFEMQFVTFDQNRKGCIAMYLPNAVDISTNLQSQQILGLYKLSKNAKKVIGRINFR